MAAQLLLAASVAEAVPTTADQDAQLWQNICAGQLPFQQMYEQVLSSLWVVRSQLQSSWHRPKAQVLRNPGAGKAIWACQAGSAAWGAASCTHRTRNNPELQGLDEHAVPSGVCFICIKAKQERNRGHPSKACHLCPCCKLLCYLRQLSCGA